MKKLTLFVVFQISVLFALSGQSNNIPNKDLYYQAGFSKIKNLETQMQAQRLGGFEDSPLHLKRGDVIFFKTNAGNYGKLQIISYTMPDDSKGGEFYMRYVVFKPDGSALMSNELEKLIDYNNQAKSKTNIGVENDERIKKVSKGSTRSGGLFRIDSYQGKVYNAKKNWNEVNRILMKDSIMGVIETSFSWELKDDLLFINPFNLRLYLLKGNLQNTQFQEQEPVTNKSITWQHPLPNNSTTNAASFDIKACVEAAETIKEFILIQNGQRLIIPRGLIPRKVNDCLNAFNQNISLETGENKFQLLAKTGKNEIKSDVFTVYYDKNTATNSEKRIALVIGNGDYTEGGKLKNPVNDANLMTQTLKNLGFKVMQFNNLNKAQFEKAIREFSAVLLDYNVALFYYAGHGVQVEGDNYLLPVDAKLQDKKDVRFEAVKVSFAVHEFENHPDNVNIVILDACRNNPFRSWARGSAEGFKQMNIGGTLVAFATAPDATASDGTGSNGLYTEELAKQMLVNQPIEAVFRETRKAVLNRSSRTQNPQEWSQLTQSFYFKK